MISTHILDTSLGMPASGVTVRLEMRQAGQWTTVHQDHTNQDGRIVFAIDKLAGDYRLVFAIENYLAQKHQVTFFLEQPISFRITDVSRKYHIPLLLSPFGLSTYRGS